ncbi:hypothetical protein Daudx_1794 [Candidatus Desulforudis audaxviator]|nr:hypothetical protein Daudx_1794 [Candidatus Desulforudis audaxviator]
MFCKNADIDFNEGQSPFAPAAPALEMMCYNILGFCGPEEGIEGLSEEQRA